MSKQKDTFYIGWQDDMPSENKKFLSSKLWLILVILPIIAFSLVYAQQTFNDHLFEFGTIKEIKGTYYQEPFPMLIADADQLPEGVSNEILLVGFGKFGAKSSMNTIQAKEGRLIGKKIVLSGTLIYGDGKTLMELTNEEASFIQVVENESTSEEMYSTVSEKLELKGEILDPKCYFGVMKPGEGKIHKSCAIRCISGGIPPVFRTKDHQQDTDYEYYILVDEMGNAINGDVLPFVGEHVAISGSAKLINGWKILYINTKNIKRKIS